jgi:hypothetical protein
MGIEPTGHDGNHRNAPERWRVVCPWPVAAHSESSDNPLIHNDLNCPSFSEYALILLQKSSDFDSAIPWFESRRPSQDFSREIRDLEVATRRIEAAVTCVMLQEIPSVFQGRQSSVDDSTQHERNMERATDRCRRWG